MSQADLIVFEVFQSVADNTDSHVDKIRRRYFEHCLRELLSVLVNLLDNTTQLTLSHRLACNVQNKISRHSKTLTQIVFHLCEQDSLESATYLLSTTLSTDHQSAVAISMKATTQICP